MSMIPKRLLNCKAFWGRQSLACALVLLGLGLGGCRKNEDSSNLTPQEPAVIVVPTYTPTPPSSTGTTAPLIVTAMQPSSGVVASTPEAAAASTTPEITSAQTVPILATPTPVAGSQSPDEALTTALSHFRDGELAVARAQLATLVADSDLEPLLRYTALYHQAQIDLDEGLPEQAQAKLDQLITEVNELPASTPLLDLVGKAHFSRAQALSALGEPETAIAAYWQFLDRFPRMGEVTQTLIANTYLVLGDQAGAIEALRRAADAASETGGDVVAQVILLERLAQIYADRGDFSQAVAVYDEILAVAQNSAYRADIQYRAGQVLAAAGDTPSAIARWQATTEEAPESGFAYAALIELVNRNIDFDLFNRGIIDLYAEAWIPAIAAFEEYLAAADSTDGRAPRAHLGIGQAHAGNGNYAAAMPSFQLVIDAYPDCDCVGDAWLGLANAQAWLGDGVAARRTYRTFARDHADHPLAPEALWRSGFLALAEDNEIEAGLDLLTLVDSFPSSERAPQSLYLLGFGSIERGLSAQAAAMLARLQNEYPDYRFDAVGYWLGRAQHAQGDLSAANSTWAQLVARAPDIYYGILAAQGLQGIQQENGTMIANVEAVAGPTTRLENDDGSRLFAETWLNTWLDVPQDDLAALPPAVADDSNLAAGRLLLALDQRGLALNALERVYTKHRDDARALYALSREFERLGTHRLSLISTARLLSLSPAELVEDAPIFLQKQIYPEHFAPLVKREAAANDLSANLFFSLIRQESLFEEGARSSAAAQGLGQIIPDTGDWVATRLGYPNYSHDLLYLPVVNLRFGAYYLGWVRDYLDGNLVDALVGYNAGPGNALAWREETGIDDTLYVEQLAFSEPRIYIQTILANLYHYTRLYGSQ